MACQGYMIRGVSHGLPSCGIEGLYEKRYQFESEFEQ